MSNKAYQQGELKLRRLTIDVLLIDNQTPPRNCPDMDYATVQSALDNAFEAHTAIIIDYHVEDGAFINEKAVP